MSMPSVLTEAASSRSRTAKSEEQKAIAPSKILETIEQHVLLDGFKVVVDLDKSRGSYLHNAVTNKRLIDLYGFFGSMPIGFNHPYFDNPAVQRDLLRAAKVKVANSDVYSEDYAEFVETFGRVFGLPPLERYLFIEGGAMAVENCLKAAMDWKVRKNMAAGRGDWLHKLRKICDENDILLIFDEVQCGMGATGRNWWCEHFDVVPDLLAFGKKAQVCGVMAGPRIDEVKDNAFRLSSRLNSTWGGNFTDMVRSTHFLRIIEKEHLVENAGKVGAYFLDQLRDLQKEEPLISAARGRGLFLAFDLPDAKTREQFWKGFFDLGVLTLRSGENSIRFRPTLDITAEVIDEAMESMRQFCRKRK